MLAARSAAFSVGTGSIIRVRHPGQTLQALVHDTFFQPTVRPRPPAPASSPMGSELATHRGRSEERCLPMKQLLSVFALAAVFVCHPVRSDTEHVPQLTKAQ